MARKREERKTSKDQLATAVRKHFNGLAVNETEVVVDFLYKVKEKGTICHTPLTPQLLTLAKTRA